MAGSARFSGSIAPNRIGALIPLWDLELDTVRMGFTGFIEGLIFGIITITIVTVLTNAAFLSCIEISYKIRFIYNSFK